MIKNLTRRMLQGLVNMLPALGFFVVLVAAWEFVSRAELVATFVLPAPSKIAATMNENIGVLLEAAWVTLLEVVGGFVAGSLAGFVMGAGIFYSKTLRRVIYPIALVTQTIPKIALAPLFIVWFGLGYQPIFLIAALICLFPVLVNTVLGLDTVSPELIEVVDSVSATRWQRFTVLRFPGALPNIVGGLEVAIALATVGALVGEFVASSGGLGFVIVLATSQLQTEVLFAAIVMVSLLGLVLFGAVKLIGALLLGRRASSSLESLGRGTT